MCPKLLHCLILLLPILPQAWSAPLSVLQNEHPPLTAELSSRLAAHAARLQDPKQDPRLGVPSPQDLETLRRIAEVLVAFGQQVIPSILGPSTGNGSSTTSTAATALAPATQVPNDVVDDN